MKKPNLLFCMAAIAAILVFSCKKDQLQTQQNVVNRQQAQGAVAALAQRYALSKSGGAQFKETANQLDYADVVEVARPGRPSLTLIHLSQDDADGRKRYLAIGSPKQEGDNAYHLEGIYSGKDLTQIEHAIQTNRIEKGNVVTLRRLDQKPMTEWDARGPKDVVRVATPKSALTASQLAMAKPVGQSTVAKQGASANQKAGNQRKDYMAPPEEECWDWYWVEYDPETGIIYSITYLFTSCSGGGGGGGGGPEEPEEQCEDGLAGISTASSIISIIEDEDGSGSGAPTRKRKVLWKCVNGKNGVWSVNSLEKGDHAFSYAHNQWEFVDFLPCFAYTEWFNILETCRLR
jgi:hypothetical protein